MLPISRHKIAIPNSLAAIAGLCCLALVWAGFDMDNGTDLSASDGPMLSIHAEPSYSGERDTPADHQERSQRAEAKKARQAPDVTFFLFPGRRSG